MKFSITTILLCFFCLQLVSQTPPSATSLNKDCSFDANNLIGIWSDSHTISRVTSMDTIMDILKSFSSFKMENEADDYILEEYRLKFSKDELTSFGATLKYYINNNICCLITVVDPEKNKLRAQKIYFLSEKYLVIQSCTNDCFTMFYIKI